MKNDKLQYFTRQNWQRQCSPNSVFFKKLQKKQKTLFTPTMFIILFSKNIALFACVFKDWTGKRTKNMHTFTVYLHSITTYIVLQKKNSVWRFNNVQPLFILGIKLLKSNKINVVACWLYGSVVQICSVYWLVYVSAGTLTLQQIFQGTYFIMWCA